MYTIRFGSACNTFAVFSSDSPAETVLAKQTLAPHKADGILGYFGYMGSTADCIVSVEVQWQGKNRVDSISFNVGQDLMLASEMLELLQEQSKKQFQSSFIECECRLKKEEAEVEAAAAEVDTESEEEVEASAFSQRCLQEKLMAIASRRKASADVEAEVDTESEEEEEA